MDIIFGMMIFTLLHDNMLYDKLEIYHIIRMHLNHKRHSNILQINLNVFLLLSFNFLSYQRDKKLLMNFFPSESNSCLMIRMSGSIN